MKKNKVIAQLIALPEKELKLFKKFVGSLTNNKKDSICRLYEFLAKNHPVYDEKKFTKRACFLHVFPELKPKLNQLNGKGDELITKKLKNPLYELKNLVDDFIIQQELATQSHEKTILLAKGLFKRQMHDKAFQLIDKELKRLEGMVGEDFYHHFYQFQLMELKQNNVMDKVKEASNLAHHALQHLDMFFTHSKLKLGYELTNRKRLLGEKIDIFLYDALLELIQERNHIKVTPSILMFKNLSQLNSEVSFDVYKKVKQYYFKEYKNISDADKKDILIYLNNFCLLKNNKVDRKFLEESYDLYCFGLENELLLENGEMYPVDFKNIVIIGTGLKKYGWVHAFIQKHAVLLPPEIRENIVLICKAQLAKSKGNLGEVIDLLQDFEFNNVYDNLTSRSLLMRCYYELGEMHTLTFFIESFTKFVNRNKSLSGEVKLAVLNMIKFTKFLCNAKYQKESKEKLKTKLDNLSPIYAKKWLLKQIEEL